MGIKMDNYNDKAAYEVAKKKVDKIRGFYIHLLVYTAINIMIIYANAQFLKPNESFFQFKIFSTAFWWGIGLLAHGVNVFAMDLIFGQNWEERKIREIMEKERQNSDFV